MFIVFVFLMVDVLRCALVRYAWGSEHTRTHTDTHTHTKNSHVATNTDLIDWSFVDVATWTFEGIWANLIWKNLS